MYKTYTFSDKLFEDFISYEKVWVEEYLFNSDKIRVGFKKAVFKKDFGPWKSGHKPYDLTFYPEYALLVESDQWELLVNDCCIKLCEG